MAHAGPRPSRHHNHDFVCACLDIDAHLEQIRHLRDEHFGVEAEGERTADEVAKAEAFRALLADALAIYGLAVAA